MDKLPDKIEIGNVIFKKYTEDSEFALYTKALKKKRVIDNLHEFYNIDTGESYGSTFYSLEMYYNEKGEPTRKKYASSERIGVREIPLTKIPKKYIISSKTIAEKADENTIFIINDSIFEGDDND